ncbi:MAG TPA: FAD-binding oxidoreductase [Candidatus Limnocylindria bacterium]|nr:FAD-binding oxidoreductase [Candidatus Limnocylindria bacterium]
MPAAERVRPATADACAATLAECATGRRSVRVRGGGTKDHQGVLRETDVVLETGALTGIVDHVPADLTVTVAAGTRLAELRTILEIAGQFLPLDPPHVARGATLGGVIAANSAGFARYRYGGVRDLLIGLRAALPDGNVVRTGGRVVKNVAGYDLNKLFTGSLGTLGVIVEATFKVLPLPPVTRGARASFRSPTDAFVAADAVIRTSVRPTALVVEHIPDLGWWLTLAAAGEPPPADRTVAELARVAADRGGSVEAVEDIPAALDALREIVDATTAGALVRAVLPLSAQDPFAAAAARIDVTSRIVADAASGIVHVQLRGDDAAVARAADALVANARVLGGGARIERSQPPLAAFAELPPRGAFLMRRIKDAFDPAGILEPARSAIG